MGIVASKGDKSSKICSLIRAVKDNNTPLLNLCKERKEFIKAAKDARYHLAKSHLLYFQSLLDFSNALNQFVLKDVILIPNSSDDSSSICSDADSDSDFHCLVSDQSQSVSSSNQDDQNLPKPETEDKTCGSRNNIVEEDLGVFVSAQNQDEIRGFEKTSSIVQNNVSGQDMFGLYDFFGDNTQCFFIEPDQKYEIESDHLSEIRKREGIPDLESDSDLNNNKKKVQESCRDSSSSSESSSSELNSIGKISSISEKAVSNSEVSESSSSGSNDLRNVLGKINSISEKAVSNNEVSELLEVSKVLHDQSLGSIFKDFTSLIRGNCANSKANSLRYRRLYPYNLAVSLSMTLEKLLFWETKLYSEVTVEEKLRVCYEKGYKILKHLDYIGAESKDIYEAETAVRLHLLEIDVSVKAIELISTRVHKTRDEELVFQVIDLINGFKEMWRCMAKCHHKQFRAIEKSKSCVHIVEKGSKLRKSTQKVEKCIGRYRESLRGYIDAQRSFVKLLNEWLNRNIMKDDENEIKAPEIFRVCREWLREIENLDEMKVLSAVEEMRLGFLGLGFKHVEEKKQRRRSERLRKELEKDTKEFEEIWGTVEDFPESDSEEAVGKRTMRQEIFDLRERVTQEREKYEVLVRELNDAVSMSLQECLVGVYKALEDFCFGNFKAYQNITIFSTENKYVKKKIK